MTDWDRFLAWAQQLPFPCVVHCYGPERTHRTTYRKENPSGFGWRHCRTADDVEKTVSSCGLQMPLSEITILATYIDGGELSVSEFQ